MRFLSHRKRHVAWASIAGALLLPIILLVVYPLSWGPVVRLARDGVIDCASAENYCMPLENAYRKSRAFRRFADWYMPLWIEPAQSNP